MPNWCSNRLVITGLSESESKQLVDAIVAEELLETFVPTPEDANAYDYHVNEWGTKWDVGGEVDAFGDSLLSYFESAWSPPIEGLTKISSLFPTAEFRLEYNEPGMCYCGVTYFSKGEVNDSYTDYDDIPGVSELDFNEDDVHEQLEEIVEEWISNQ